MGSLSSVPTSIPTKETANAPGQKQRFELGRLIGPRLIFAFERQPVERFAPEHREWRQPQQRKQQQRQSKRR